MPCHTGKIFIEEQKFKDLSDVLDSNTFRSPSKVCKIGFTQTFRILGKKETPSNPVTRNHLPQVEPKIIEAEHFYALAKRVEELEIQMKELRSKK
jgi:hypothetical protein